MLIASHCGKTLPMQTAVKLILEAEKNLAWVNPRKAETVMCNSVILLRCPTDEDRLDNRRDGFGVWLEGHRRSPEFYDVNTMTKNQEGDLVVRRVSWVNKSAKDLRRTEVSVSRVSENPTMLCIN